MAASHAPIDSRVDVATTTISRAQVQAGSVIVTHRRTNMSIACSPLHACTFAVLGPVVPASQTPHVVPTGGVPSGVPVGRVIVVRVGLVRIVSARGRRASFFTSSSAGC